MPVQCIAVSNGNRTEWSPIRSLIIRVSNNHNFNKICDILSSFLIKTQEIPRFFLLAVKKSHLSARVMARTVQLLRHDAYCPI